MSTYNHYGIWIDSDKPVTGVIQNNRISEFISDEICGNAVDLTYLDCLKEFLGNSRGITRARKIEQFNNEYESMGDETYLLGAWKKNKAGKYYPDTKGEYAAICGEIYTQIVYSKVTTRARMCSPCYPGQADLDSPDDNGQLCYTLPADCMDDNTQ